MVDLVQDDESPIVACTHFMDRRISADLRIRNGNTIKVRTRTALSIRKRRVNMNTDSRSRIGPLAFQMFSRADDGDLIDDALTHQLHSNTESKGRFTRTGSCNRKEVTRCLSHVLLKSSCLPCAK